MKSILTLIFCCFISFFGSAQTFSWSGNMPILDLSTIYVPITVSGLPNVIDSSFGLAHICMDINHTYDADLVIKIIAPNGDSVTLIQGIGGANDNFLGTCVGVDGTFFSNASAPYSGIFQPIGNTFALNNGQNPNGTWQLKISDVAASDIGNITNASIVFVNNPPYPGNSIGGGSGPTGTFLCGTCTCPNNTASCDLLPDMTSSFKEINLNHNEVPGALYISNATPNIGFGPLEIYAIDSCFCDSIPYPCATPCPLGMEKKNIIRQRIYKKMPGNDTLQFYDHSAGLMTYHEDHGHLHVDHFANYTLRTSTSNPDATTWPIIASGSKQSFCLINLGTCPGNPGECVDANNNVVTTVPNQNLGFHTGCGVNQGIYPGNYDVYSISLNDPILLTNVCNGNYYIVSITDPENNFIESDESNNWVAVPITLTQQNGSVAITASGPTTFCNGDSVTLTANPAANYLWSTNQTTQSITVYNAGSYTVSSNCGTNVITSAPVVVNVISSSTIPTINISLTAGANPSCLNASVTFTATITNGGVAPVYQWKVNGNNVGTNSLTFTTSTLTNGDVVSCQVTSSLTCITTNTATSNSINMIVSATQCYCVPVYGTTANSGCLDGDVIARVTINTLDNNSGTGCPGGISGYSDYYSSADPSHTTSMNAGNTYSCTVWAGQYGEGYKVWIDMNDDGLFAANETIGNTNAIVPGSGSVGVLGSSVKFPVILPCSIPPGNHRMRVRCIYNNSGVNIDPCIYQNNFGEAEDYKITILPPVGCVAPSTLSTTNITSDGAKLIWLAGCTETQWNVHVTAAGGGAPSGAPSHPNVNNNNLILTNLLPLTAYEFWVQANCNANSTSSWVGPFPFTTLTLCASIPGSSMSNPIQIGNVPCASFPYIDANTNTLANCFTNNYTGANNQASPDIWYQFTLVNTSTVEINHCSSGFDTYLHLLDASGTQLLFNDDNGPLCTTTRASIVAANLAPGTYYIVSEGYSTNTGLITSKINTTNTCNSTNLILNCFIQGYWDGANGMSASLYNQGLSIPNLICDSITVELHNALPPYSLHASAKALLQTNGMASCAISGVTPDNYYIVIRHRNALETWSAGPVAINTTPVNYNFSSAANKAYGNNQVELSFGKWAFFSGDINQDKAIDAFDYLLIEPDVTNGASGYVNTDLNGDGTVDSFDYLLLDPNVTNGEGVSKP